MADSARKRARCKLHVWRLSYGRADLEHSFEYGIIYVTDEAGRIRDEWVHTLLKLFVVV